MTKTMTIFVSHLFLYPALTVMMPMGTTVDESFVWNLEFGALGFV